MMDVIDLSAKRNKREQPDSEFVHKDDFGRPLFCYLLHYEFDGGQWSTELWAYSMEDATARVEAIRASLKLDGQMFRTIPA